MAEQAERAFARTFLNTLASQPVTYDADYQQPPQNSLKKVPVLPIPVPPPPERKPASEASGSTSATLSLTIKSLKPPASYTLNVQPTDTIAHIKAQLASQPSAPPVDAQRLLCKGKALADGKLLKEYAIKDGDTVNLMVKPGFSWDPTTTTAATTETDSDMSSSPASTSLDASSRPKGRHQRIPSVVLSPSPSGDSPGIMEKDIMLTVDAGALPAPGGRPERLSTYHQVVSKPEFWKGLLGYLKQAFTEDSDVNLAFEDFLCAAKGSLTASEIAKIRDQVGIVGMAGT